MGLTQKLGTIPLAIFTDASNNIGIGGSPSGSFKFEVTGTARVSGLLTGANATFGSTGTGNNIIALSNNDQSNTRLRITNTGSGGQTFSIVGGNPGVSNAGLAIFDETNSTTRLYVSSTGNVGIGTSSPTTTLHLSTTNGIRMQYVGNSGFSQIATDIANNTIFSGFSAEYMRITSGGNVCIGTTTSSGYGNVNLDLNAGTLPAAYFVLKTSSNSVIAEYALDSGAAYLSTKTANPLIFRTTDVERMRIASNGQVTITTGVSQPLVLTSSTNNQYLYINSSGGGESMTQYYNPTAASWYVGIRTASGLSSTSGFHIYSSSYGNDVMGLYANGNYDFAGSDVSDRRLKENIKTIEINAIDAIMQLVPKTYIMTSNPDVKRAGFIAQEVQEILPDLINGVEGEDEFLGLDYNGLLAYSIKAIQELSAKVSALENKA